MQTPIDWSRIEVIAPNFKRRLSGVTSTVVRLVPIQSREIGIVAAAPVMPPEVPCVAPRALIAMPRTRTGGAPRVFHARRNAEMLAGLALKVVLRKRLKLLFTSASQRKHSGYTKWLIRRMDAVVATSELGRGYLEVPAQVIHHGIDTKDFAPAADRAAVRRNLGLPEEGLLVGCFGRIRKQKGTDLFVHAMLDLLETRPDAHAIVMGRATEKHRAFEADLKAEIAARGLSDRLRFLPEVPVWQMPDWYRALDIYVAPQRWEGFGLTPLEAMACGVPVVAARVGAFAELVEDGTTGRLIDIADLEAMKTATAALLDDDALRAAWSRAARARAESSFDIAHEAAALTAIYRRLLER